ncbi:MAG: carbohydrate kinase family protein [Acetobacter sp.]|nr:carbohydrate kinase family protein [Bacteroides sp.]MCM1340665.1 carbohydrate kinase family protein [Acetobacter sp.]MCM1433776.1 carbohydrate kinase family protein [Clostridiales bacterium]
MAFIAGAGATNVDLLYQGFERLAGVGEELYCKDFSLQLGGGLPATLINLGRLGIETKIATELGNDIFSEFAKEKFTSNGVSPTNLYSGDKIPLNITSAIILPKDRTFYTYGKGSIEPDEKALEEFYSIAKGAKICMMQLGGFKEVYKKLKSEGTKLVLDTGWDDEMSFEKYNDYLELADYYTPNRKEAMKITGESTPENSAKALKKYFEKVVVKVDADGCIGIDGNDEFFCKSVDEFKNVDSTGAGDAFLAGFMYGLFYDYKLKDCIEFGNITGGKAVTQVGALSGYVNEKELLEYKEKYFA